ncbi:MAG: DUF4087 domain-containing protein [Acidobacteria bacterium]|nr:DUF4087 domain-containing protein [Acidobacteriota bacterium]
MKHILTTAVLTVVIAISVIVIESRPSATVVVEAAPVVRVVSETRCGWFSNPTPGNAWLDDADGSWTIGAQGGYQAEGDWPDFKPPEWVKTNGEYGYGCACMNVTTDKKEMHVLKILKAWPKPLSTCRNDKKLKEPKDD